MDLNCKTLGMTSWVHPYLQLMASPPFPVSARHPHAIRPDDIFSGHLRHATSSVERPNVHSPVLWKPKPIRLSDMQAVSVDPRLYECHRNLGLGPSTEDGRFRQHFTDHSTDHFSQPVPSFGSDSNPDAFLSRLSYLMQYLPGIRHVPEPLPAPEPDMFVRELLHSQMPRPYYRNASNPGLRLCSKPNEAVYRNMPLKPQVLHSVRFSASRENSSQLGSKSAESAKSQQRLLTGENSTEELRRDNKRKSSQIFLQKLRQRALKHSRKHFLTPVSKLRSSTLGRNRHAENSSNSFMAYEKLDHCLVSENSLMPSHALRKDLLQGSTKKTNGQHSNESSKPIKMYDTLGCTNRETMSHQSCYDDSQQNTVSMAENAMLFSPSSTFSGERKTFRCPHCRYLTDRKNNLKRHIVTMHQESGKTLECCGLGFQSKAALRDHNAIFHRGGYRCQICSRNFCRKALLRRHLTVHSGQKDFFCDLCGYATSHKSNLERHQKVHNKRDGTSLTNKKGTSLKLLEPRLPMPVAYSNFLLSIHDLQSRQKSKLEAFSLQREVSPKRKSIRFDKCTKRGILSRQDRQLSCSLSTTKTAESKGDNMANLNNVEDFILHPLSETNNRQRETASNGNDDKLAKHSENVINSADEMNSSSHDVLCDVALKVNINETSKPFDHQRETSLDKPSPQALSDTVSATCDNVESEEMVTEEATPPALSEQSAYSDDISMSMKADEHHLDVTHGHSTDDPYKPTGTKKDRGNEPNLLSCSLASPCAHCYERLVTHGRHEHHICLKESVGASAFGIPAETAWKKGCWKSL